MIIVHVRYPEVNPAVNRCKAAPGLSLAASAFKALLSLFIPEVTIQSILELLSAVTYYG
jgi:hypothetical protein